MQNNNGKKMDTGVTVLLVCGIIAVALIVVCVFFPNLLFGLFFK